MKFWTSTIFLPPDEYLPLARASEAAGVYGMVLGDHLVYPKTLLSPYPYTADGKPPWPPETPFPDVWVTIGAMIGATSRLHFGTSVYIAPARDLLSVAKEVGTAAVLSGNRVHLGVGAGWMKEEFELAGQSFRDRGRRLSEMIEALRALWSPGWAEFHGEHYNLSPVMMSPTPSRTVPIWCGGYTESALTRATTLCDGWVGVAKDEDHGSQVVADIKDRLNRAGRSREPFEIVLSTTSPLTPDAVQRWEAIGVTSLLCRPWAGRIGKDLTGLAALQASSSLAQKLEAMEEFGKTVVAATSSAGTVTVQAGD